ncbi:KOW motif-containing protein [Lentzea sp. NPDC004782]|uniref:KOW motif-containing protein n=1 Tax=Lentzea sp. NPDC004782 TaxID=3154458 RepID=UPI0033A0D57F
MDVDTARRTFPHGTRVRVVAGPLAGQTGAVVGIDVEVAEQVGEAVLTIDVGADFDESVAPSEVEIIGPPSA